MQGRLKGKVALVTGSGSGIGQGCALLFARQGAAVMGCDLDAAAAAETVRLARSEDLTMESVHPCDLTVPEDVQRTVDRTVETFGRLDILVNAAATAVFAPLEEMRYADWRRTISGELDVVFLACKTAWPHLRAAGGGSIINFSSVNAYHALEGSSALAHCAGKGGVLAMTRQLALEGAPYNIRANTIAPGMIVTGATRPVLEDTAFVRTVLDKVMLKRLGRPDDVAWCAVFLASDEASWITAADFSVDGGARAL